MSQDGGQGHGQGHGQGRVQGRGLVNSCIFVMYNCARLATLFLHFNEAVNAGLTATHYFPLNVYIHDSSQGHGQGHEGHGQGGEAYDGTASPHCYHTEKKTRVVWPPGQNGRDSWRQEDSDWYSSERLE